MERSGKGKRTGHETTKLLARSKEWRLCGAINLIKLFAAVGSNVVGVNLIDFEVCIGRSFLRELDPFFWRWRGNGAL